MNSARGSTTGAMTNGPTPPASTVAGTSTMAPSGRLGMYPRLGTLTALRSRGRSVHMAPMIGKTSSADRPARCMGTWDSPFPYRVTSRSMRVPTPSWKYTGTGCHPATSRANGTYSPMWLSTEQGSRPYSRNMWETSGEYICSTASWTQGTFISWRAAAVTGGG